MVGASVSLVVGVSVVVCFSVVVGASDEVDWSVVVGTFVVGSV